MEAEYSTANGHEHDAEVIYGDTDSVMVKFGPTDLETVMAMGARPICNVEVCATNILSLVGSQAADFVTSKFIKPIKLEFEKVYFPYLLISKKRYAGLYWTRPEKYDKMDTKGIEVSSSALVELQILINLKTVRRDNCRLVATVISTCLNKLLIDRDVKGAEEYVHSYLAVAAS